MLWGYGYPHMCSETYLSVGLSYRFLVFRLSAVCVNAEAATDLAAFEEVLLRKIFEAFVATLDDVFSFLAITNLFINQTPAPHSAGSVI